MNWQVSLSRTGIHQLEIFVVWLGIELLNMLQLEGKAEPIMVDMKKHLSSIFLN